MLAFPILLPLLFGSLALLLALLMLEFFSLDTPVVSVVSGGHQGMGLVPGTW